MYEKGIHGSASFDGFHSYPHFSSVTQDFLFSPFKDLELNLNYGQTLPSGYQRPTANNSGAVTSLQKYKLEYVEDYAIDVRLQKGFTQFYLETQEKRQRTNWTFASSPAAGPTYLNYFRGHWEDISFGMRNISQGIDREAAETNLSRLTRSLLRRCQWKREFELRYRNGFLQRSGTFYLASTLNDTYRHKSEYHLTPRFLLGYGLDDNLELEGGFNFTSPFTYDFHFQRYNASGTSNFIDAHYRLTRNIDIPTAIKYRPQGNMEMTFALEFEYIRQRLDSSQKNTNGTTTLYLPKKLGYYHLLPALQWTFLMDAKKEIALEELSRLTKRLLREDQFLVELTCQRDISILRKGAQDGTQNIIDPENVFLFPMEFFVAGSEYSAFFSGNSSSAPTQVKRQNHFKTDLLLQYGLKDALTVGLGGGYISESTVHQFDVKDQGNRFFRFKPFYYVDLLTDWNVTKGSLLSFKVHFVPRSRTFLQSSAHPEEFKDETRYLEASLGYQKLF